MLVGLALRGVFRDEGIANSLLFWVRSGYDTWSFELDGLWD